MCPTYLKQMLVFSWLFVQVESDAANWSSLRRPAKHVKDEFLSPSESKDLKNVWGIGNLSLRKTFMGFLLKLREKN